MSAEIMIALKIMGMGMGGIFSAMIVIMLVTYLLKAFDRKPKEKKDAE